jgi:predicted nucleic acid-binding protein
VIVLDASVAAKLYRDEAGSDLAHAILHDHGGKIVAPDIFAIEVASVLVREANILKDRSIEFERKLATFSKMLGSSVIELKRPVPNDIGRAAMMAVELGHPLKDCLYLVLAIDRDCDLVTADVRFAARARSVWHRVQVLEE